ncbi:MAG: helix-turn-helix transcriptional regulator [Synergistaceae bacterium]|nr:helix-turn-helix transcriptional regulator [Synergistaceae bacterium]
MDRIFANTMIYFRKKAHLTQSELALKAGIAQSQVSKIEEGTHFPTIPTISKFCRALGISGNEFLLHMGLDLIATALKKIIWLD